MLDHIFHTNIVAYCQQNRYTPLAVYTDLFTLSYETISIKKQKLTKVRGKLSVA